MNTAAAATKTANEATATANEATATANEATETANAATATANAANATAEAAKTGAQFAITTSMSASQTADDALEVAKSKQDPIVVNDKFLFKDGETLGTKADLLGLNTFSAREVDVEAGLNVIGRSNFYDDARFNATTLINENLILKGEEVKVSGKEISQLEGITDNVQDQLDQKQGNLEAGSNITIEDGVISSDPGARSLDELSDANFCNNNWTWIA